MASINYSIKGKYDNKGVKQAVSGFKTLQQSVEKINALISGFAAIKAIQSINKLATETKEVFTSQNEALTKFNTAVSKTNLSLSTLQAIQAKVSRNNLFDGDAINNASAMAATMGLTEEQIEKVLSASVDMAASGIMPLDNAVKALSLSYSGNISQLKKMMPELSALTNEEIRSGAAVDIIAGKYEGFADSLSNTFSGRNTQWKNSIDDLRASIGSIPASLSFITEGKLLEPLNKVTDWIVTNRDYIINFFLNLPAIAKIALNAVLNDIKKLFSAEGLNSIVTAITDSITNVSSNTLSIFAELIKGIIEMIKAFCTNLETGDIGKLLLNAWYKLCNQLNEMFFKVFDVAGELLNGDWKGAVEVATGKKKGKIAGALSYNYEKVDTTAAVSAVVKVVNDMGKNIQNISTDILKDQKNVIIDFLDNFQGLGEDQFNEIKNILAQDLPEDLKAALAGITYNGAAGTGTQGNGGGNSSTGTSADPLSSLGQIGTYAKAEMSGGTDAVLLQFLSDVINKLSATSEIVSKILNVVDYFIEQFVQPLLNLLEPVLNPMLSIIKSMGEVVASIITVFTPFFEIIAACVEGFAQSFFWLRTFFVSLFDTVYYGFVEFENWLIKIYNTLCVFNAKVNYKSHNKSWEDISKQWALLSNAEALLEAYKSNYDYSLTSSGNASGGTAASYTAQRDIIVNVTYSNSYVNGDAREIAVSIYKEIKAAERLGVV